MGRPDYQAFMAAARAEDPHGRRSNSDIERAFEIECLEWDLEDITDVDDVRCVLRSLMRLIH